MNTLYIKELPKPRAFDLFTIYIWTPSVQTIYSINKSGFSVCIGLVLAKNKLDIRLIFSSNIGWRRASLLFRKYQYCINVQVFALKISKCRYRPLWQRQTHCYCRRKKIDYGIRFGKSVREIKNILSPVIS